jgi:hypothetical protein
LSLLVEVVGEVDMVVQVVRFHRREEVGVMEEVVEEVVVDRRVPVEVE